MAVYLGLYTCVIRPKESPAAERSAAQKLAVDCQIEQRPILQAAVLVEGEADAPNPLRLHSALCAYGPFGISNRTLGSGEFRFKHLHNHFSYGHIGHL
tara:strand:+ start:4512 stop:4805 length:294 start_codon:yes stop_codon:yes gene_type:complete